MKYKKVYMLIILTILTVPFVIFNLPDQSATYLVTVKWDAWDLRNAYECGDEAGNDCEWNVQIDYCGREYLVRWTWKAVGIDANDYSINYTKSLKSTCSSVSVKIIERDLIRYSEASDWISFSGPGTWERYKINQLNDDYGFVVVDITILS